MVVYFSNKITISQKITIKLPNTAPLGASSTQHKWELLAGNGTAVLHGMRGEGGSWVWCMCAPCFNLSFENSDLNCSLPKEFEIPTLQRKIFRDIEDRFLSQVAHKSVLNKI